MSLFANPREHAENPPESWEVRKVAERTWHLTTKDGTVLGYGYPTKTKAEADKVSGPYFNLYNKEADWYAGKPVAGWKPYQETS